MASSNAASSEDVPGAPSGGQASLVRCGNNNCVENGKWLCSRCRQRRFCSYSCFQAAWASHKVACSPVANYMAPNSIRATQLGHYTNAREALHSGSVYKTCIICMDPLVEGDQIGSHIIPDSVLKKLPHQLFANVSVGKETGHKGQVFKSFCKKRSGRMSCEDVLSRYGEKYFAQDFHNKFIPNADPGWECLDKDLSIEDITPHHFCIFSVHWRALALSVSEVKDKQLQRRILKFLVRTRPMMLDPVRYRDLCSPLFAVMVLIPTSVQLDTFCKDTARNLLLTPKSLVATYAYHVPEPRGEHLMNSVLMGPLHTFLVGLRRPAKKTVSMVSPPKFQVPPTGCLQVPFTARRSGDLHAYCTSQVRFLENLALQCARIPRRASVAQVPVVLERISLAANVYLLPRGWCCSTNGWPQAPSGFTALVVAGVDRLYSSPWPRHYELVFRRPVRGFFFFGHLTLKTDNNRLTVRSHNASSNCLETSVRYKLAAQMYAATKEDTDNAKKEDTDNAKKEEPDEEDSDDEIGYMVEF